MGVGGTLSNTFAKGLASGVSKALAPKLSELAPSLTTGFVREALRRAIEGVGPLAPAALAANRQLAEQNGHIDRAIHDIIETNVRLAGGQGFLTNVGGLVTAAVTIPANVTGLTLIQCRMIAGIAHLRGYDLDDAKVRNAILMCLIDEERIAELVAAQQLPAPPMALATAPAFDPQLDVAVSSAVAAELIGRIAGKRLATTAGRRVPLLGGLVGAGADGFATWKIGRYTERELLPRARR